MMTLDLVNRPAVAELIVMASPVPRVFISYARKDGADHGHAIARRLVEEHSVTVWRDTAQLEGGRDWWRQITEALSRVEYLVLVITRAAIDSTVVRDEWRYARTNGVCVLPVLGDAGIDAATLPAWMRQTHLINPDDPEQWTRMVRTLEGPCRAIRVPMMVDPPPSDFVPRLEELAELRRLLVEADGGSVAITAALKGAGGFGKTTLARALCHDDLVLDTYFDGILWVTLGERPSDAATQLEDLIVTLSGAPSALSSREARRARLQSLLDDRRVLLVIDDAWRAAHVEPFLLGGPRCARLITTRNSETLPPRTREVRVDQMRGDEARSMLQMGLPHDDGRLSGLAARLGEWPLLLKLANSILRDRIRALDTLPHALVYVTRLLDQRGLTAFDARDPEQRHEAVAATLGVSLDRLTDAERTRLTELAIFPEDVDIPVPTIVLLWQRTGGLDPLDSEVLLQRLYDLSLLVNLNMTRGEVRLHDVVRSYLFAQLPAADVGTLHRTLVEAWRSVNDGHWAQRPLEKYFYRYFLSHLAAAGYHDELRSLLLDPAWIERKLTETDLAAVFSDYKKWAADPVTRIVGETLILAGDALAQDNGVVLQQLIGRITDEGVPELSPLLASWRARSRPSAWLSPQSATLTQAGGPLIQTWTFKESLGPQDLSIAANGKMLAITKGGQCDVYEVVTMQRLSTVATSTTGIVIDSGRLAYGLSYYLVLFDVKTNSEVWSGNATMARSVSSR